MTLLLAPARLPAAGADLAELRPGRWVEVPDSRLRSVAPAVSPGGNEAGTFFIDNLYFHR